MANTDVTPNRPGRPAPVADWSADYDIFDRGYVADPYPVWDELRTSCPVAHSRPLGRIVDADEATPT